MLNGRSRITVLNRSKQSLHRAEQGKASVVIELGRTQRELNKQAIDFTSISVQIEKHEKYTDKHLNG